MRVQLQSRVALMISARSQIRADDRGHVLVMYTHQRPPHATAGFGVFDLPNFTPPHATAGLTVNRRVVGSSPTRGATKPQVTGHIGRLPRTQWNDHSHVKVMAKW